MDYNQARHFVMTSGRFDDKKEKERALTDSVSPILRGKNHRNTAEDRLITAIDEKDVIVQYRDWIEKMRSGKSDPEDVLRGTAPDALMELIILSRTAKSEKVRAGLLQDRLDRAGFSKVQKHAIANIDPNAPKEQLISMILGLNQKNKVIEIEDDDEPADQDQEVRTHEDESGRFGAIDEEVSPDRRSEPDEDS